MRAYTHADSASSTHPTPGNAATPARLRGPGISAIAVIIAAGSIFAVCTPLIAAEPPADLARRVAHRESEAAGERLHYTYTQSVKLQEIDGRGAQAGEYREVREVIFSPEGERSERFVGEPVSRLKNLILTPEDFADIRNIQPFILTEDQLRLYQTEYKGEERIADHECWVLSLRPRQILSGQRLFEGILWVKQDDYSVIRSEGKAVPQIVTLKQENLFPRFTTERKQVNGFWFPSVTSADDTLYFRGGPIREKLTIRYEDYRKFGSDSSVTFEK